MDDAMMPKMADFGLSRLLGAQKSRTIICGNELAGSLGYMAPEYQFHGVVSPKADIFSFGVLVIEIITGERKYPISFAPHCLATEISLAEYRENVRTN
ncbi:hypothetical protein PR202_gb16254 [Eleusine coracana subsp. coracana]|uniref:Protein kinase domain-containing protein n=1 Tax=Eleusine coracana subsp. coracana TaxID=191504 RepID=A0AAV5F011_ELECO|nr:hypothetical protein PR202_gb16254 [Eleusine coracana subsp. coracana]